MPILRTILNWVMKKRIHQIELFLKYPHDVQRELWEELIEKSANTEWGKKYGYSDLNSVEEFQSRVPISDYEDLYPYIERVMKGEKNILWPTTPQWFAKSSGTTNARSKFIPVTPEALEDCHFKGGKDMLSIYFNNYPDINIFAGKSLSIGGSHQINHLNPDTKYGDVSAVILQNLPIWAQLKRTPSLKTALMENWDEKVEAMAREAMEENVTSLAGVPTWTLVVIKRILEITGADNIKEVWPNLELFAHGAVSFDPYREIFNELIPDGDMNYLEIYNASEGFLAIQDQPDVHEMLLMLDYGIFYEFIPMEEWNNEHPRTVTLEGVEVGKNYAVVISTNAGLWRYKIGDTVRFTSTDPYRIKISGRTKHFINAFGEEVIVENAEKAITVACEETGAIISEYTAAPVYFSNDGNGAHEWIIEFEKEPNDSEAFKQALDRTLREVNSDYDAKRSHDIALRFPTIHFVSRGTFYNWMKSRNKLGGQHKVPRLANNREYLESILSIISESTRV